MVSDPNRPLLNDAVSKLGPLLSEVVFVGGITLGLQITDEGAAPIRRTNDVDVIVVIATAADYVLFSERLRESGFTEDMSEKPLLCRWHHSGLTLDVLPVQHMILGFTNIWYESAFTRSNPVTLSGGALIHIISAPFFLGTKMEAFRGRGKRDFLASHDLEDFIAVIDGRPTIVEELSACPTNLKAYLAEAAQNLLAEPVFRDVLPGYVLGDDRRVEIILDRLTQMARFQ